MPSEPDTVRGRLDRATADRSPALLAGSLAILATVAVVLLFSGDPLVHEAAHQFRHGAGVTCH